MRIGVVSDTHNNLKNCATIVALFNDAGVDAVIHTGDITQAKTLDVFAHLAAPLHGVFGNNDVGEREALQRAIDRHGFRFYDPPWRLTLHGRSVMVVHDPLEFDGHLDASVELALHGHTHLQRIERNGNQLLFNPGECAGHMAGLNTIGVVDLVSLEIELLKF